MTGIKIARDDNQLTIDWQQSKLEIPLHEAVYVTLDQDILCSEFHSTLLHTPYSTRDRIMIQTGKDTYLLLNDNRITIMNRSRQHH
ncbi:hypothetical protein ACE3MZ_06435 [Paenibacillus sp. WLX1005]|uniref:SunI/YnzG family protein n=1 Tax=Paenibacillus sp. WLX1005 TaxID=3243766 RepID=UPI0039845559